MCVEVVVPTIGNGADKLCGSSSYFTVFAVIVIEV